jgi:3-polyprenyl-4-hydroxybenzoate decarboxylase
LQTHKQGCQHYRRMEKAGRRPRMDVGVAIGSDPATMYSAILPLPPDLDEIMISGFIRGKPPPMEDFYMGKAIERIFLLLLRLQLPEVRDICMPAEGIFQILVAIRKSYPGHARKVMHAIWGLGQAMFSKCIVVVDEEVDVQDARAVA